MDFTLHVIMGMVGSVAPELLAARARAHRMNSKKLQKLFKSPMFWLVVASATLVAGLLAAALLDQVGGGRHLGTAIYMGAGARALLQQGAAEVVRRGSTLGGNAPKAEPPEAGLSGREVVEEVFA